MDKNGENLFETFKKNEQRRSVLIEPAIVVITFAVVIAFVAFYLIHSGRPMDRHRTYLELERVGSLVMEEMVSAIREAKTTELPQDGTFYLTLMMVYPDTSAKCFTFDDINKDIKVGPDYDNLTPLELLDDSYTVGDDTRAHRITCDDLQLKRAGDRMIIRFGLRHDLDNGNGPDDLTVSFGSAVKLRG